MVPSSARRRLLTDRLAALAIRAGGVSVILSILLIFVFLLAEIWPVLRSARVEPAPPLTWRADAPEAVVIDPYRTYAATLGGDGVGRLVRLAGGAVVAQADLGAPLTAVAVDPGSRTLAGATADGRVLLAPASFAVTFEGTQRRVVPALGDPIAVEVAPGEALDALAVRRDEGDTAVAAHVADGRVVVVTRSVERNAFTGAESERVARRELTSGAPVTALAMDPSRRFLFAGTPRGELLRWDLRSGALLRSDPASAGVSSLALLIGGRALVVGREDGDLSVWFGVPETDGGAALRRIRGFPAYPGAIRRIAPSERDRSFLVQDEGGETGLHYSTSGRTLWRSDTPLEPAAGLAFAPKGDGALLASASSLVPLSVENPHPELSIGALFGRVWYEGFPRPEWVWQSSSGDDEFEAKLSLMPLLAGTLKGTFYALLLAVPLGVLGAMYTSQFMHPRFQRWVKPSVEIMAALPSVVLGFLAGLWLAPRLERVFPSLVLMAFSVPVAAIAAGWIWERIPRRIRARIPDGAEVAWMALLILAAAWACTAFSPGFERAAFDGSFPAWLDQTTGWSFDQRNAVVVGIAMGFAVIPIIFAIAEDSFSNVPADLSAGSLALGANRWQTVVRVVLPTASPGIFSAIMIGFGRAVGETMIVLMATGNTPIMDWNPFNGFRTLSANIAVEIPEAPHGGTLYRTLFISALLLFAMTFFVNTLAEQVRHRLRRRFGRL